MTFRRLFALLVGLWAVRHVLATFELPDEVQALWGAGAVVWGLVAAYLFIGRHVHMASAVVLALIGLEFMAAGWWNREGVSMLAWLAFIVGVTEGRPTERALLVRVCATVVYLFGAVSKLNPSWLAGEGLIALPGLHPPLSWAAGPLGVPAVATAAAVSVIGVELLVAAGLWSRRFRPYAAAAGLVVHIGFVATLARTPFSFLHLVMLNGGLLLCYLAFWAPIQHQDGEEFAAATIGSRWRNGFPVGILRRAPGAHTSSPSGVTAARKTD